LSSAREALKIKPEHEAEESPLLSSVGFCTGGSEDRTREHEAEESPVLEAVAVVRLVKI
jgi:hypothetical protein